MNQMSDDERRKKKCRAAITKLLREDKLELGGLSEETSADVSRALERMNSLQKQGFTHTLRETAKIYFEGATVSDLVQIAAAKGMSWEEVEAAEIPHCYSTMNPEEIERARRRVKVARAWWEEQEKRREKRREKEERQEFDTMIIRAENAGRQCLVWEQIKDRVEPIWSQILEIIDTVDADEITDAECALLDFIHESFLERPKDRYRKRIEDRHEGEEEN